MSRARRRSMGGPATGAASLSLLALCAWLTGARLEEGARRPLRGATLERLAWRIDLNAAPEHELTLLPRIGPTMAARIAADRAELGPFASVDELLRVRGVGPRTVQGLAPDVVVRPAPPTPNP